MSLITWEVRESNPLITRQTLTILASPPIPAKSFPSTAGSPSAEHTLAMPGAANTTAPSSSGTGPTASGNSTASAAHHHLSQALSTGLVLSPMALLTYAVTW